MNTNKKEVVGGHDSFSKCPICAAPLHNLRVEGYPFEHVSLLLGKNTIQVRCNICDTKFLIQIKACGWTQIKELTHRDREVYYLDEASDVHIETDEQSGSLVHADSMDFVSRGRIGSSYYYPWESL